MTNLRPLPSDREPIAGVGGKASPRWRAWLQRIESFIADLFGTANTWTATQTFNAGIKFPATQVPSADPNTLDDYEEGTWTPTITFGGAAVGVTYGTQSGTYVKVGGVVFIRARLTLTSKGSSTGAAVINGLPFTAVSTGNTVSISFYNNTIGLTGMPVAVGDATTIDLRQTGATATSQLNDTHIANTFDIVFDVRQFL